MPDTGFVFTSSMCLAYFSYHQYDDLPLCILTNRDEYYERPSQKAHFWESENLKILGGKDSKAGGSWFAVGCDGRWALVTNYRDPARVSSQTRSRGLLVSEYLQSNQSAAEYIYTQKNQSHLYNGFNLLLGDATSLHYYSNITGQGMGLGPGLYGLSNHLLDTPWPKVKTGKKDFGQLLENHRPPEIQSAFAILQDRNTAPDEFLPNTGIDRQWEKILSARFIISPEYGTRATTLIYIYQDKMFFSEQSYDNKGTPLERQDFCFSLSPRLH